MALALVKIPDAQAAADALDAWAKAAPQLARMLERGAPPASALARWGMHLLTTGRGAEAVAVFRASVALGPQDATHWTNLGVALDRAGATAEACACLERSVTLQRHQPSVWLLLGMARKKTGALAGALEAYLVARQQEPGSLAVLQCLGLLREEQRDYRGAIECFIAASRHADAGAAIHANLGKLLYETGRIREAHDAYEAAATGEAGNAHYAEMLRRARFLRDVLHGASADDALARFDPTGTWVDGEDVLHLLDGAAGLLAAGGHIEAATRVATKRLELTPHSPSATYLLDALTGRVEMQRAPSDYVVETFDAFAQAFEDKLVGVLGYDVPEKLCALVRSLAVDGVPHDTLDAGCGTGLCGPWLRPISRRLVGVDLSAGMLAKAAERNVYDELVREELVAFLERSIARFDVMVAADVLIYFGDLAPLFAGAAVALRPGGLLAVSAELLSGDAYSLRVTGRFAHAVSYVREVARHAFVEAALQETQLRLDAGEPVRGSLFVFRRA